MRAALYKIKPFNIIFSIFCVSKEPSEFVVGLWIFINSAQHPKCKHLQTDAVVLHVILISWKYAYYLKIMHTAFISYNSVVEECITMQRRMQSSAAADELWSHSSQTCLSVLSYLWLLPAFTHMKCHICLCILPHIQTIAKQVYIRLAWSTVSSAITQTRICSGDLLWNNFTITWILHLL